jgi:hypothetical protein
MKKVILAALTMVAMNAAAQTQRIALAKGLMPKWQYTMVIENNQDTSTHFGFSFQNQKYVHIQDLGVVVLMTKDRVNEFIAGLRDAAGQEKGITYTVTVQGVRISVYDFSNNVFIEDRQGKYFTLTKKQALNFADAIEANIHLLLK